MKQLKFKTAFLLIAFFSLAVYGVVEYNNIIFKGSVTLNAQTASRALATDSNKNIVSTSVTSTELGYLSGVTSALQTQIDGKQTTTLTSGNILVGNGSNVATSVTMSGDATINNTGVLTIANGAVSDVKVASGIDAVKIGGGAVSNTEFGYLDGVTSALQTQIDGKQTTTLTSGNILVGNGSNVAASVAMSGDATIANTGVVTIGAAKVGASKIAMTSGKFFYGVTGVAAEKSATEVTALLDAFTGDSGSGGVKGLVPAPSAGDAAANKYLKSDGTWTVVAASGGGLKNYISNTGAETDTTGWATYADAAGTTPVDCTGGSPSSTFARSTTTPLSSTGDFNWTKSAANRQGEGFSYAFTTDPSDSGKPLQIEFNWELISGTWAGSTAPATDSDMIVYIYDVTNAALIQPQGRLLDPAITGQTYRYRGTFQTMTTSTSYRLCVHTATTSASAYTLAFDDFRIGPQVVSNGAVVTDWQSYTPTISAGFTASNVVGQYRIIGDELEARVWFNAGTVAASLGSVTLPSGFSIDSAKIIKSNTTANNGVIVGHYGFDDAAQSGHMVTATGTSTSLVYFSQGYTTSSTPIAPTNGSSVATSNVDGSLWFKVPIVGRSSNVQMSSDSDTRVVAMVATSSASQSTGGVFTTWTLEKDSHAALNTTSGVYTVPVSGYYNINFSFSAGSGTTGYLVGRIIAGGTSYYGAYLSSNGSVGSNASVSAGAELKAGDTITVQCDGTSTSGTGTSYFSVFRMSGPSQIAASEKIAVIATGNPASNTSGNPIIFPTATLDTHGSYSTSTGLFTAPSSGIYVVHGQVETTAAGGSLVILEKNGSTYTYIGSVNSNNEATFSGLVQLNAGDTANITTNNNGDATANSSLNIHRLGN